MNDPRERDTQPDLAPLEEDDFPLAAEPDTGRNHTVPDFAGLPPPAIPPGVTPKDWREAILGKVVRMGQKLKAVEQQVAELRADYDDLMSEANGMPVGG